MPALDVQRLTYTYPGGQAPALQEITLQVEAGQLAAVVGANGAGKSTLCLALAGLIPGLYHGRMQGSVTAAGLDTRRHAPGEFAGRVGLVLQNPANQLSGMRYTVYEEVAFGLENLGTPRQAMPARIEAALERTGLLALRHRSPYALSSGQQQRLALAALLALQPAVLILDEPTAMLDPRGSRELFETLRSLADGGAAVVIADHHLEWIARHADQVYALSGGRVIAAGAPHEVLASPLLLDSGIGWLRYTHAAAQAAQSGRWPAERPLPVTLEQAAAGFEQAAALPP
ncbi:MAG: energy-coupling factor ABC transporter ATP-binding protein, partial [Chloroflexota bacterium]